MSSVLSNRRHGNGGSESVKYTPCAKIEDQTDEEELEEIAVISRGSQDAAAAEASGSAAASRQPSNEDPSVEANASSSSQSASNGPRSLPPVPLPYQSPNDRTRLIGERLSNRGRLSSASPMYANSVAEAKSSRSTSRHSIFEIVTNRLSGNANSRKSIVHNKGEVGYVNKALVATPKEVRKQRRKEIDNRFGKNSKANDLAESSIEGSIKEGCKWTFVFDPSGRFAYWWSFVVSIAFLYNFWVLIYRFAFEEINASNIAYWFTLDYTADLIYVLDIAFHFRTGFLEDGVLQTDSTKLRIHYMNSTMFYIDCLCLLPLDFLYLSIGYKSMLRCFRLIKIYRYWAFLDRTERHTIYPNTVRTVTLMHYLFAIYHWNACLIHVVTKHLKLSGEWACDAETDDIYTWYLHSLYWSTLTLTTIGELPRPKARSEYIFVVVEFVFGLLLFSTILGHVANIVTNISFARKDFQAKLDSVKTYMSLRRVPMHLQERVIRWFDYLWLSKTSDEEKTLQLLPNTLRSDIALHVHLDTLKRVEIFQNTEAGFLCELVLKLRPVLFSPGDFICRKGEVGKEMYIVSRGKLRVVTDNGKTILAMLRAGSYFGEISILNMGSEGNRRTASVRSVGYSDLFVLSKKDLWDVLQDYPTARVRLEAIAGKRLAKYKKAPLEQCNSDGTKVLHRSKSTPGLVESMGKIPLESMAVCLAHHAMGSSDSSQCTSRSHTEDFGSLPENLSGVGSGTYSGSSGRARKDEGRPSQKTVANITNSMTVSSITSYISDSSAHKSPSATDQSGKRSLSPVAPPREPSSAFIPIDHGIPMSLQPSSPSHHSESLKQHSPSHHHRGQPTGYHQVPPAYPPSVPPPMNYSPYHGYSTHMQQQLQLQPPDMQLQLGPPTSPSMLTARAHPGSTPSSFIYSSGGVSPNTHDGSSELLLQEISRLRERLQTLETENASMNRKLNKQQWDVENRLAEIEMQVCGSEDHSECEDIKCFPENKESMI